jgi:hypothetical protein
LPPPDITKVEGAETTLSKSSYCVSSSTVIASASRRTGPSPVSRARGPNESANTRTAVRTASVALRASADRSVNAVAEPPRAP